MFCAKIYVFGKQFKIFLLGEQLPQFFAEDWRLNNTTKAKFLAGDSAEPKRFDKKVPIPKIFGPDLPDPVVISRRKKHETATENLMKT